MSTLRAMVASCCLTSLSLLICLTSGCAATAPAAEKTADATAKMQQDANAATPPRHDEEIWVVQKYNGNEKPADDASSRPGAGALLARLPDRAAPIPFTLKHTDVKAEIAGYLATVDVTQQYANPFNMPIEAVYVFSLPRDAAVCEFIMIIGQRKIRGIIRDRDQAMRIYRAAKAQGYTASLLKQDQPDVFSQSVANIEPNKPIDINIRYLHALDYADGWYAYRFPMKGVRDLSLSLRLDAGAKIDQLQVPSQVAPQTPDGSKATVTLALQDVEQGQDFLMRYRVAGGGRLKPRPLPANHLDPATAFLSIDATGRATTQP